ncbi:MAG: hypothetical protein ABI838_00910, partial [Chloroflexota bacterium]
MDDYQKEISDLEKQIEELVEAEGDKETIADLSMQAEILKALYAQAHELLARGRGDADLRAALEIKGYGDWNLDNVYAFIYERAVELPPSAHQAFVGGIRDADFA